MPRHQRRLLYGVFSASIGTTIVSIIHAYFVLGPSGLVEGMTANIEVRFLPVVIPIRGLTHVHQASVSLLICNLAVLVTHIYRLVRGGADEDDSRYFNSGSSRSNKGPSLGLRRLGKSSGSGSNKAARGGMSALRFATAPGQSRVVFGANNSVLDEDAKAEALRTEQASEGDEKPFGGDAAAWNAKLSSDRAESPTKVYVTQETFRQ
jgi:hypothetical protein